MDWLLEIWNLILSLFGIGNSDEPVGTYFKCSMFFPAGNNPWDNNQGNASSLSYVDTPGGAEHRAFMYKSIVYQGGDTLLYIGEKLFNNSTLQEQLTGENNEVAVARKAGIQRWIVSIKNDNNAFPFGNVETLIQQIAACYSWASPLQMAFMTCLESNEILSVAQVKQMIGWCKKYAPDKRVIVGNGSPGFLQNFKDTGAELWLEIQTNPFVSSRAISDAYIGMCNNLKSYGPVWVGEYWLGDAPYISRRAAEIGAVGVGSYVKGG